MEFYTNGQTVASWITIPPHLSGWSNLAHGGILFTALDEIMGRTMIYLLQRFILTKSMTIEYLKPVPHGRELKVEGRILEVRSEREAVAEGIIINDAGEVCTRATGLWPTLHARVGPKAGGCRRRDLPLVRAAHRDEGVRAGYRVLFTRFIKGKGSRDFLYAILFCIP